MKRQMDVSVSEIAQQAGVSSSTVSRVLNNQGIVKEDTRQRVLQALAQLNVNADSVISAAPPANRLILFSLPFEINSFFNEIIRGAKASAMLRGYHFLIHQDHINHSTIDQMTRLIKELKISGLFTLNHIAPELIQQVTDLVPLVQCCDYDLESKLVSSVCIDDFKAGNMVVDYLLSLGRRRIAFVSGPLIYRDNYNRKLGYLQGLRDAGLEPPPEWIVHLPEINYDMALSNATQILSQPNRPDAFFAISDIFAAAAINAASRLQMRVPEDLAVVGFDNLDYAMISSPTITTVNLSQFQMGYMACELLAEKVQNPAAQTQHIQLPHELIIRESTSL